MYALMCKFVIVMFNLKFLLYGEETERSKKSGRWRICRTR
nr:MAG TPA: RNA dependent RNA polymerase [Caudoviricetes sp.]